MRRIIDFDLTLRDATGKRYVLRQLALKLLDTLVKSVGLALILVAIGQAWGAFH